MITTRSVAPRYSGETIRSTLLPLVCDGAVVRNTVSGMVMGLCLRAYTTRHVQFQRREQGGRDAADLGREDFGGPIGLEAPRQFLRAVVHQHGIDLMVDEGIDFEDAAPEVAAVGENALLQCFHSHAP